jgi:two-component system response regulator PilR (NtrC family)
MRPVGSQEEISVDVRILSATHKNLAEKVQQGAFREDLFYRLNVIELSVPALRERRDDIPVLVDYILEQLAAKNGLDGAPDISDVAMEALQAYDFQGNVRELENILERALTWMEGDTVTETDLMLPEANLRPKEQQNGSSTLVTKQLQPALPSDLGAHLEDQERQLLTEALESVRWNKTAAAKKLGISFRALRYKLKKLGLE